MAEDQYDPQILLPVHLDFAQVTRPRIGRILLVDDDPMVRELTSSLLRRGGHVVVAVERASMALRELEKDHEGFDLVITDLVMPGMTGMELARRLRLNWPSMPVLFISGYSDELLQHAGEVQSFLAKPYSAEGLLATVGSLLGGTLVSRPR